MSNQTTAARSAAPRSCTLLLPVGPELADSELVAAVDVLVRTAPAALELRIVLVLAPDLASRAPATAAVARQLGLEAVEGGIAAVAASVAPAAEPDGADVVVVVVDAPARPDLAELPTLLRRLTAAPDPLPFVHRPGLLVTRARALADAGATESSDRLPALARRLRPRPVAPDLRPSLTDAEPGRSAPAASVAVVLVADAPLPALDVCLTRLQRHLPPGAEVVLVDPGGDAARSRALRTLRWARVVPGSGVHPVAAGIAATAAEILVLLDPAAWVTRRLLAGLADALRADPAAVAAGPLTNLGLGVQQAPDVAYADIPQMEAFAERCRNRGRRSTTVVDGLVPACVAVRRSALVGAGGLDESFADPMLAWIDLWLRLRADGGRLLRIDGAFVHVAEMVAGSSTGRWHFGGGGELAQLRARHGVDADRALPGLLGAVMIVKDEEDNLARALESVSGLVDDVVVCDTGSTDGTVELIDACGARATAFAWTADFSAARNAALAAHTGTWGLLLDADETVESADVGTFRHWLARNSTDVGFLVCRNLESGTGGSTVDNASSRLLRAADCHWTGRIHEQMVRRDGRPARSSASDGARIIHHGYSARMVLDRRKVDRNSELTRLQLDDSGTGGGGTIGGATGGQVGTAPVPGDEDQLSEPGRAHFERGRAEMLAGRKDAAEQHFRRAVELLTARSALLRRMAFCNLATLANESGRHAEALGFATSAVDDDFHYTQAALALAIATLQVHGADPSPEARGTARQVLEATVRAGRAADDPSIGALLTSLRDEGLLYGGVSSLLGGLLLDAGAHARVVEVLLPLAQARPALFEGWSALCRALQAQGRTADGTDWAHVLAAAAASDPGTLEPLVRELSDADRATLFAALAEHGIEDWQVSETERTWRALQPELRRMSRAGLVAAARQQEAESPELALRLWRFAGDSPQSRVGQARCLDAMDRPGEAADVLDGLDVEALEPADTLFVAALAAQLGDTGLALALLDSLPAGLDESLAAPSRQMRELLTA